MFGWFLKFFYYTAVLNTQILHEEAILVVLNETKTNDFLSTVVPQLDLITSHLSLAFLCNLRSRVPQNCLPN